MFKGEKDIGQTSMTLMADSRLVEFIEDKGGKQVPLLHLSSNDKRPWYDDCPLVCVAGNSYGMSNLETATTARYLYNAAKDKEVVLSFDATGRVVFEIYGQVSVDGSSMQNGLAVGVETRTGDKEVTIVLKHIHQRQFTLVMDIDGDNLYEHRIEASPAIILKGTQIYEQARLMTNIVKTASKPATLGSAAFSNKFNTLRKDVEDSLIKLDSHIDVTSLREELMDRIASMEDLSNNLLLKGSTSVSELFSKEIDGMLNALLCSMKDNPYITIKDIKNDTKLNKSNIF